MHNLSKMQITIAGLSHFPYQLWFRISFPCQAPIKEKKTPHRQLNMLTLSKIGLVLLVIVVRAVVDLCQIFASVPVLQALADLRLPQS